MLKIKSLMLFVFLAMLAACTQEEVVGSVKASIQNTCRNARNCTTYDDNGAVR